MNIENISDRKIPQHVKNKALQVLERLEQKQVRSFPLKYARKGYVMKIEIGYCWRGVSRDGLIWFIISHEQYSRDLIK